MTRPTRTVTRNRPPQLPAIDWAPLAWQAAAACAGTSLDLWFRPNADDDRHGEPAGARAQRERRAKAFCLACPVEELCLAWAFEVEDGKGDWFAILGGTTADERRRMRRNERRKVAR